VQTYEDLHRHRPEGRHGNGAREPGDAAWAAHQQDYVPTLRFVDQARRVAELLDAGHTSRGAAGARRRLRSRRADRVLAAGAGVVEDSVRNQSSAAARITSRPITSMGLI
jgi:hypothetical protein